MQQSLNPWVTRPLSQEDQVDVPKLHVPPAAAINSPLLGMIEPDAADRLDRRTMTGSASVWITGAHGGAGESRIAEIIDGARVTDHCWPSVTDESSPAVLLVCRADMRGLTAARNALTQWASGAAPDLTLLGLAVLADAPGKVPKELREFAALVGGGAPRQWTLSWVDSWRVDRTTSIPLTREYKRFIADVAALASKQSLDGHQ